MARQSNNLVPYSSYRGPLYRLVCKGLPQFQNEQGDLMVRELAAELAMSHEGVYKWFRANRLPVRGAKRLCALSDGRLKFNRFFDFL